MRAPAAISSRTPSHIGLIAALPVIAAIYYSYAPSSVPLVMGDTASYINFFPDRPIGYPLFLYLIKLAFGQYDAVPYIQVSAYCTAAGLLGYGISRSLRSSALALVVEAGILLYPGPISLAQSLLSDSLSATTIILFAVGLIRFADQPSVRRFAAACVVVALAVTLRPVNIALLPVLGIAGCLYRREFSKPGWKVALTAGAIVFAGMAVTPLANYFIHGALGAGSPFARGLVQKVMFIQPQANRSRRPECGSDFIDSVIDPVNAYLRTVPSDFRDLLRFDYSQVLRFEVILPGLAASVRHPSAETDRLLMCYTIQRLSENPTVLATQSAREYWNLVSNYTFIDQAHREPMLAFLREHPPVLPPGFELSPATGPVAAHHGATKRISEVYFEPPKPRNRLLLRGLQAVQILGATIAAFFTIELGFCLRSRPAPERAMTGLIALSAQALLLATSVAEMAQPRYLFPVWPLLWTVLALGAFRFSVNRKAV